LAPLDQIIGAFWTTSILHGNTNLYQSLPSSEPTARLSQTIHFTPLNKPYTGPSDLNRIQTTTISSLKAGLWFVRLLPLCNSHHFRPTDSWRKSRHWLVYSAEVERSHAGHPNPEVKIQRASKLIASFSIVRSGRHFTLIASLTMGYD
jgi:hypothetical protein